jgi:hypothetical protein
VEPLESIQNHVLSGSQVAYQHQRQPDKRQQWSRSRSCTGTELSPPRQAKLTRPVLALAGSPAIASFTVERRLPASQRFTGLGSFSHRAGGGTPYFPLLPGRLGLELIETQTFSQVVYLRYRRSWSLIKAFLHSRRGPSRRRPPAQR